jgi:hypothetical protein
MLGAVGVLLSISASAAPSIFPTGTTRYDPAKAFNSFVLFTGGDNVAHLIDLNGNSVHEWKDAASHSTLIDPSVNGGKLGHVFVTLDTIEGKGTDLVPGQVNRKIAKTVGELDWDGKVVWSFGEKAPGGASQQHHDWARLPNGNTVVLANLVHPVKGFNSRRYWTMLFMRSTRQGKWFGNGSLPNILMNLALAKLSSNWYATPILPTICMSTTSRWLAPIAGLMPATNASLPTICCSIPVTPISLPSLIKKPARSPGD